MVMIMLVLMGVVVLVDSVIFSSGESEVFRDDVNNEINSIVNLIFGLLKVVDRFVNYIV